MSDRKSENEPRRSRATGKQQRDKEKDRKMSKIWKKWVKGRTTKPRKQAGAEKSMREKRANWQKKKNHNRWDYGKGRGGGDRHQERGIYQKQRVREKKKRVGRKTVTEETQRLK